MITSPVTRKPTTYTDGPGLSWPSRDRSLCLLLVALAKAQRGQNGQEVRLPEGAGQQMVQSLCAQCHGLNQIVRSSGYDLPGWRCATFPLRNPLPVDPQSK